MYRQLDKRLPIEEVSCLIYFPLSVTTIEKILHSPYPDTCL